MNLFDILGPVMVGPSSSHTAGAVRLGRTARRLLGEGTPREAAITLFGSFAATGHGHGTDRALIAGLLGFQPDDERIARSFDIARDAGMAFSFTLSRAGGEHPNTARIDLVGQSGKTLSMTGSSLGGGRIMVNKLDGIDVNFTGMYNTLVMDSSDIIDTLVYRLEKIKKLTGLDLREFDDAITFKVALMVKKYLTSNPMKF